MTKYFIWIAFHLCTNLSAQIYCDSIQAHINSFDNNTYIGIIIKNKIFDKEVYCELSISKVTKLALLEYNSTPDAEQNNCIVLIDDTIYFPHTMRLMSMMSDPTYFVKKFTSHKVIKTTGFYEYLIDFKNDSVQTAYMNRKRKKENKHNFTLRERRLIHKQAKKATKEFYRYFR